MIQLVDLLVGILGVPCDYVVVTHVVELVISMFSLELFLHIIIEKGTAQYVGAYRIEDNHYERCHF